MLRWPSTSVYVAPSSSTSIRVSHDMDMSRLAGNNLASSHMERKRKQDSLGLWCRSESSCRCLSCYWLDSGMGPEPRLEGDFIAHGRWCFGICRGHELRITQV